MHYFLNMLPGKYCSTYKLYVYIIKGKYKMGNIYKINKKGIVALLHKELLNIKLNYPIETVVKSTKSTLIK